MSERAAFRLGAVSFDPSKNEVSGPGGRLHLEPRVMDFAVFLAQRPGKVVTRDELIESVWNGYPSADQSLTNAASKLRRALNECGGEPTRLQTIPKRGYRLSTDGLESAEKHGLAVLPFRNLSDDAENDFLCEGLAEELLNALSRLSGLRVAARSASFALAQREIPLIELGRQLNVDYAIEGGVQKARGEIRVRVGLVEARTETQVWADNFRWDSTDLLSLQDAITDAVINELRRRLNLQTHSERIAAHPSVNSEAYACYLKGRFFWDRDNANPGKALEYFHKAIELAPDFAAPYAGLVDCYCTYAVFQLMPQAEARANGLTYAARALSLAPESPDVRFSYGYAQFYFAWDWDRAEAAFREALERDPEHMLATSFLGLLLTALHRHAESRALVRRLLALDPVSSWRLYFAAQLTYYMRDFESAAQWAKNTLEVTPGFLPCAWIASSSLAQLGRTGQAMPLVEELERNCGDADLFLAFAACVYVELGAHNKAEHALAELQRRDRERGVDPMVFVSPCAMLGYENEAIKMLQAGYEEHNAAIHYLSVGQFVDPIRHRPEFQEILKSVGLNSPSTA